MLWLIFGVLAFAQQEPEPVVPEMNTQLFRPSFDSRTTLWAESAGEIGNDGLAARAFVGYLRDPLVYVVDDGTRYALLQDALQLQLLAAYRFDRFRLGVDVPVWMLTTSDVAGGGAGMGDLSVDGRATLVDYTKLPLGLAITGRLTLPTATTDVPLGHAGVGGQIGLLASARVNDLEIHANLGQRFLPTAPLEDASFGDEFYWTLGGGYPITDGLGVSMDVAGTVNYAALRTNGSTVPAEVLLGGWGRVSNELVVRGGVGRGVTPGIGAPAARALLALSYEPRADRDSDGDGLVDSVDQCPHEPEDFDEFEDHDGCPDLDNDGDGIVDVEDACPNDPEDFDGYDDEDGCPDPSREITIRVVNEQNEDIPDADVKLTGRLTEVAGSGRVLADLHDGEYGIFATAPDYLAGELRIQVPLQKDDEVLVQLLPAAKVGTLELEVQDPEGKPVTTASWMVGDRPGPELVDGRGTTQVLAGEHMVVVRARGFGPARLALNVKKDETVHTVVMLQPAKVKVTREQININETIFFETGKAVIKPESFRLLNEVAQILLDNPDIERVRVEGHTDIRGGKAFNQKLSENRAASVVDYLVKQGVERTRLISEGFGPSRPLDDRNVPEAWEKNRRVDFFIESRAEPKEQ